MNDRLPPSRNHRAIAREAAAWVVREERGLTAPEQDALSHWLASDPRHGEILRERRLREESATLEAIGQTMGISKERVRQIENRALEKLKRALLERNPDAATAMV